LLEHLKYLSFHNDVKPGEKFFWFSTTGWMMWNFVQAALLKGATVVLYDGSPGFPNLNVLWKMAENTRLEHFGTSAPYLIACMKRGIQPGSDYDLSRLRSLSSTGAPLPPEAFDWVYQEVKKISGFVL
jgi:acetoacetyl-CoA synthetase